MSTSNVRREGYLVKRAIRSGRNWKTRFFVLDNATLWYFKSKNDDKPRGEIRLTADTIIAESTQKGYMNCIEIATPKHVLIVSAPSQREQEQWMSSLLRAVTTAPMRKSNSRSAVGNLLRKISGQAPREDQNARKAAPHPSSRANNDDEEIEVSVSHNARSKRTSTSSTVSSTEYRDDENRVPSGGSKVNKYGSDVSKSGSVLGSSTANNVDIPRSRSSSNRLSSRDMHSFKASGTVFEVSSRYRFIKSIGHGAYGVVVAAEDRVTQKKVAIKKVTRAFEDLVDAKRILREIKLMRHFDHENVIHIQDLLPPRSYRHFEDIYIVSELMETDLHRVIYSKQALTSDHIQYFVYQILRSLKYIHSANVLHRDLKPSNVLLNSNCDLKICDFGLARGVDTDVRMVLTEYVVTRWYRAPEIMLACREYTKAIDMWSVGCIFAELLGRKPLFAGDDYIHQLHIITDVLGTPPERDLQFIVSDKARRFMRSQDFKRKVPWSQLYPKAPEQALDLLDKMLRFNPASRISVEDALAHPYLETLYHPDDEPVHELPFDFDDTVPDDHLNKFDLQTQIAEEIMYYHPDEKARFLDETHELAQARAHQ